MTNLSLSFALFSHLSRDIHRGQHGKMKIDRTDPVNAADVNLGCADLYAPKGRLSWEGLAGVISTVDVATQRLRSV